MENPSAYDKEPSSRIRVPYGLSTPLSRLYANSPLVYPLLTRVFVSYPRYRYPSRTLIMFVLAFSPYFSCCWVGGFGLHIASVFQESGTVFIFSKSKLGWYILELFIG